MSGTRSHSPLAPVIRTGSEALLVAAHGECGGDGGNVLANELVRRIRLSRRFDEVALGYMRGHPSIEEAVAHIASDRIRLYPLFMSDGYYVNEAIPTRLGIKDGVDSFGHRVEIETPLGLHPKLPELLLSAAASAALGKGIAPSTATLLLAAHGSSKSPHAGEDARRIRDGIERESAFAKVDIAFLEEKPFFVDVLAESHRPTFVLGLFAGCGLHGDEDLHRMVSACGDPSVYVIEQLGGYAGIIELIAADLGRDG
jgi:sirohydrochlorin cobaltochelatase